MNTLRIVANDPVDQHFPNINPATNFVPDWYKKSPQNLSGTNTELVINHPISTTSTYKKCSPFLDALTSGYMIYTTCDIEVTILDNNQPYIMWRSSTRLPITTHDNIQWEGLHKPENCHNIVYKWENNFIFNTPPGYSCLFTHPLNRFDLPFYTLSGVVDTDGYSLPVKFPFFLKKGFTGVIEKNTPVAQLNFIKRENWDRTFLPFDEMKSIINSETFFSKIKRSYKNNSWNKKVYK
jgi:hypothetical protein